MKLRLYSAFITLIILILLILRSKQTKHVLKRSILLFHTPANCAGPDLW